MVTHVSCARMLTVTSAQLTMSVRGVQVDLGLLRWVGVSPAPQPTVSSVPMEFRGSVFNVRTHCRDLMTQVPIVCHVLCLGVVLVMPRVCVSPVTLWVGLSMHLMCWVIPVLPAMSLGALTVYSPMSVECVLPPHSPCSLLRTNVCYALCHRGHVNSVLRWVYAPSVPQLVVVQS